MTTIETPAPTSTIATYGEAVVLLNRLRMTKTRHLARTERRTRRRWHKGERIPGPLALEWAGVRLVLRERGEKVPYAHGLDGELHACQPERARTPWVEREGAAAKLHATVDAFTREAPRREGVKPSSAKLDAKAGAAR